MKSNDVRRLIEVARESGTQSGMINTVLPI